MKTYCVKWYTTHVHCVEWFDSTGQAAKDMGVNTDEKPPSPEQARRDDAALSKAVLLNETPFPLNPSILSSASLQVI